MPDLQITQLTADAKTGVFDALMKSVSSHVDTEFRAGRIKGAEYATVYLGSLELALQIGMQFLLSQRKAGLEADLLAQQVALATQQTANAVLEGKVLVAQECKLRAEFDLTTATITKTNGEIALLAQKTATEKAQVLGLGVDADSVVGRQKALYQAQADGFKRDAEQKVAKIMADTWAVRRTTDEATQANATNMLDDAAVGRAMQALLSGVNA